KAAALRLRGIKQRDLLGDQLEHPKASRLRQWDLSEDLGERFAIRALGFGDLAEARQHLVIVRHRDRVTCRAPLWTMRGTLARQSRRTLAAALSHLSWILGLHATRGTRRRRGLPRSMRSYVIARRLT